MSWQDVRHWYEERDEPDDEPRDARGRRIDPTPIGAFVEWWEPFSFKEDGRLFTMDAPVTRWFYGPNRVAWKAACRFADLMRRRGKRDVSVRDID